MIKLEIDGQSLEAEPGSMVIQAADAAGIYIPRFCYHKKLPIAANCRMCLVQVGEGKKPAPACATPVAEGMKIATKSEVALKAQEAVMEFLLINHPLDCPICDQGGQCELQDLAMGYGKDYSRYTEAKRVVADLDQGSLIQTDMTRCIQCTRCVRFGREIAGLQELGILGRGEHEEISSLVAGSMKSELSGNLVEVCPVGALTAKPSRYSARAWELQQRASVSPHDGVGSHLSLHVRRQAVMRVVPRENEAINEVWLSDRDRFSYEGLASKDRITQPQIKKEGVWQTVDWLTAFEYATQKLQTVLNRQGAAKVTGLVSASATLEEHYLFQKLLRGVGSENIDHRLSQVDLKGDAMIPELGLPIADLENQKAIFLIGANVPKDQPVLSVRLRKALKKGARLMSLQSAREQQTLSFTEEILTSDIATSLKAILKAAGSTHTVTQNVVPGEIEKAIANHLMSQPEAIILGGADLLAHPDASELIELARLLSETTQKKLGFLALGANSVGAALTKCFPEEAGLNWQQSFEQSQAAYLLMGIEPEFDCARPGLALEALNKAEAVVVLNTFTTEAMLAYADVILPIAPFSENSGTLVNIEGKWQSFAAAMSPLEETRPGWKVLRVLSHFLKVESMEYANLEEVTKEIRDNVGVRGAKQSREIPLQRRGGGAADGVVEIKNNVLSNQQQYQPPRPSGTPPLEGNLKMFFSIASNRADPLLRRATSLQARPENMLTATLHPKTAEQLGYTAHSTLTLNQNNNKFQMPIKINESIAIGVISISTGFSELIHFDPYA